jgi:hypothetical protein
MILWCEIGKISNRNEVFGNTQIANLNMCVLAESAGRLWGYSPWVCWMGLCFCSSYILHFLLFAGGICLHFDFCDPAYRSVYISLGWLKRLHFRHARCFLLSSAYKQLGYGLLWSSTWKIHTTVSKLFSVSLIWTPRTYISTCRTQHFTMSACPGSC